MRGVLDIASRTNARTDKRESFSSQRRCRETKKAPSIYSECKYSIKSDKVKIAAYINGGYTPIRMYEVSRR